MHRASIYTVIPMHFTLLLAMRMQIGDPTKTIENQLQGMYSPLTAALYRGPHTNKLQMRYLRWRPNIWHYQMLHEKQSLEHIFTMISTYQQPLHLYYYPTAKAPWRSLGILRIINAQNISTYAIISFVTYFRKIKFQSIIFPQRINPRIYSPKHSVQFLINIVWMEWD